MTVYLGGFSMIHTQKCKELCGHDYSDGLLIDSTNVHKVRLWSPCLKRHHHFALFPMHAMHCGIQSTLISITGVFD